VLILDHQPLLHYGLVLLKAFLHTKDQDEKALKNGERIFSQMPKEALRN